MVTFTLNIFLSFFYVAKQGKKNLSPNIFMQNQYLFLLPFSILLNFLLFFLSNFCHISYQTCERKEQNLLLSYELQLITMDPFEITLVSLNLIIIWYMWDRKIVHVYKISRDKILNTHNIKKKKEKKKL